MKTNRTWIPVIALPVIALWMAAAGAAIGQQNAKILDASPNAFPSGKKLILKIAVQNTGSERALLRVEPAAESIPAGWTLEDDSTLDGNDYIQADVEAGRTDDVSFIFKCQAATATPRGVIVWKVSTVTTLVGIPIKVVERDQFMQPVELLPPPGEFKMIYPEGEDQDVPLSPTFSWKPSSGAVFYRIELASNVLNSPNLLDIFWVKDSLQTTSVGYDGQRLLTMDTNYHWRVTARNDADETIADGEWRKFTTVQASGLGAFSITYPRSHSTEVPPAPVFEWTASENSDSYILTLHDDVLNVPNPIAKYTIKDLTTPKLDWAQSGESALEVGKTYHLMVVSVNQGGKRSANDGYVPFTVSLLPNFTIYQPADGVEDLPRRGLTFTWQACPGAEKYRLEIRLYDDANPLVFYAKDNITSATEWLYDGQDLEFATSYSWRLYAIKGDEEKRNHGGDHKFTTMPIGRFLLNEPAALAQGVSIRPSFKWQACEGALSYLIEVAPAIEDIPDLDAKNLNKQITKTSYDWQELTALVPGRKYFWRVTALNLVAQRQNEGGWTSFGTLDLESFVLTEPADGATSVVLAPMFRWTHCENATTYTIVLARDSGAIIPAPLADFPFYRKVVSAVPGEPGRLVYDGPALGGPQTFWWRVLASNTLGARANEDSVAAGGWQSFKTLPSPAGATGARILSSILAISPLVSSEWGSADRNADGAEDIADAIKAGL